MKVEKDEIYFHKFKYKPQNIIMILKFMKKIHYDTFTDHYKNITSSIENIKNSLPFVFDTFFIESFVKKNKLHT